VPVIVLLTYGFYPSFSNTLFQAFNCFTVDGTSYLRADFAIVCTSDAHGAAQRAAAAGIAFCSLGIPVLYLALLYRRRRTLGRPESMAACAHLAFFYEDYKPEFWYWEALELGRKLVLTGFAALWKPGTLMQIITAMLIGLVNIVIISSCKPYCGHAGGEGKGGRKGEGKARRAMAAMAKRQNMATSNSFALQSVVATFLSLFGALLVKFNSGFTATGAVEQGYDFWTLQLFLIATAASTGLFGLTVVVGEAGAAGATACISRLAQDKLPEPVFVVLSALITAIVMAISCVFCCRRRRGGAWRGGGEDAEAVEVMNAKKGPPVFRVTDGFARPLGAKVVHKVVV